MASFRILSMLAGTSRGPLMAGLEGKLLASGTAPGGESRFCEQIARTAHVFRATWHTHEVRGYPDRGGDVKIFASLLAVVAMCAACSGSQPAADSDTTAVADTSRPSAGRPAAPRFREVTLPVGTTLRLKLQSALASDSSQVEDTVRAELGQPVVEDGITVLPAGTQVVGNVIDVARSGRVKGRARLAYRFTSLTHGGERYDIATAPLSHEAEATKRKDATKIAIGAGAGAAVGALLGGGDGAAKGAAIGGAGGTGVVLATRGEEVRLGPGASVTTRLTTPLTVRIEI